MVLSVIFIRRKKELFYFTLIKAWEASCGRIVPELPQLIFDRKNCLHSSIFIVGCEFTEIEFVTIKWSKYNEDHLTLSHFLFLPFFASISILTLPISDCSRVCVLDKRNCGIIDTILIWFQCDKNVRLFNCHSWWQRSWLFYSNGFILCFITADWRCWSTKFMRTQLAWPLCFDLIPIND